jgi:3-hydroxyisobutyrate dehydrogenase-like beta-hydroxyacid dehydrogenase
VTGVTAPAAVGVVGLGKMGRPIARHVAAKGHEVVGFDLDQAAMSAAAKDGVVLATDLDDLLARARILLVAVDTEPAVRSVIAGAVRRWGPDAGGERDRHVAVILATITVTAMRDLDRIGAEAGFTLLDAPLCKGEQAAEDGELLTLVGGPESTYEVCRPVLDCFSSDLYHLGGVGTGQAAKLVNNLILWASISATSEGFWLAGELGADLHVMREALLKSSGRTWALETWYRPRTMPWAAKDMGMVLEEANRAGLSLPLSGVVHEVIKTVKQRGLPGSTRPTRG